VLLELVVHHVPRPLDRHPPFLYIPQQGPAGKEARERGKILRGKQKPFAATMLLGKNTMQPFV
jgi:hypothetical protein